MNMRALKLIGLSLLCAAALAHAALAQSVAKPAQGGAKSIEGTYSVTANSSELGAINFVLILKRNGDKWTGEVKDSPTPLTITSVTIDDTNKITMTVDAGGTAVSINGKFDNDEFAGDFSAGDIKGTLKGAKKDAAKPVSLATLATFEGTYDFKYTIEGQGDGGFTLVIKLKGNKLVTEVPNAGDVSIVGIEVKEGDEVTLMASYQGSNSFQLPGKRTGNEMGGKWAAGNFSGDWSAKKK